MCIRSNQVQKQVMHHLTIFVNLILIIAFLPILFPHSNAYGILFKTSFLGCLFINFYIVQHEAKKCKW